MRSLSHLKPQDILVLLKILTWEGRAKWMGIELARELGLSPFDISVGLERSRHAGLLDPSKRKVIKSALLEFLVHGLKYVYPAQPGAFCRGVPTAHSAPPLAAKIVAGEHDSFVWPTEDGNRRGQTIPPLCKSAPRAAQKDPVLYELLALVDAIRVGRAREREMAIRELTKRFAL